MSIGDLRDTGNQGNNLPFQWKVLQGLQEIIGNNTSCCDEIVNLLTNIDGNLLAQKREPIVESHTGPGQVPGDVFSFSIANVGSSAGDVNGVSIPAGTTLNFDAGVLNNKFNQSFPFDATGTTFIVTYIVTA